MTETSLAREALISRSSGAGGRGLRCYEMVEDTAAKKPARVKDGISLLFMLLSLSSIGSTVGKWKQELRAEASCEAAEQDEASRRAQAARDYQQLLRDAEKALAEARVYLEAVRARDAVLLRDRPACFRRF